MKISREEVLHIALLARLGVTDEDVDKMSAQLSDIMENFEILNQVDTEGIPPTAQSLDIRNVIFDDEVRESLPTEKVLENAPRREGDFFKVRAVLE